MMISSVGPADFKAPNYAYVTMDKRPKPGISFVGAKEMSATPLDTLKAYAIPFTGNAAFEQKVIPAGSMKPEAFDDAVKTYTPAMTNVIDDFKQRVGIKDQFLNWVTLPTEQLKNLDNVYRQAGLLKERGGKTAAGNPKPLVVLGIGGSKHTGEFLLNMAGAGKSEKDGKVFFYSDIDPVSYQNFMKETGVNIEDLNFLVVSKSGTTFETKDGYMRFRNALKASYMGKGMDDAAAEKAVQKHFAFATDANGAPEGKPKNLRDEIGKKNGEGNDYIKELYVHDDVGGRYSMFDDPGIFALAYAGVDPNYTTRILKGAEAASATALDTSAVDKNKAARAAMFNAFATKEGRPLVQQQLFGKVFEGGGENWSKQLYLESLKDFNYGVGGAPASMHYASEGHFNPDNKGKYTTILTRMKLDSSVSLENYIKYTGAIEYAYNNNDYDIKKDKQGNPVKDEQGNDIKVYKGADSIVMVEELTTEGGRIKPEAIGEYIQSKHFETVYMGMLRRALGISDVKVPEGEAVPEVLQPSVEVYKNNFKKGVGNYVLEPGATK